MKLNKPVLPRAPEAVNDLPALLSAVREDETDITERLIVEASLTEEELDGLCFRSSRLENCRFLGCSFHRAAFLDVVFEGCDLSNSDFDSAFLQRCRFHNCKGVAFKHCPECGAKVTLHKSCEFCRWHLRDGTCFNKHHSQPVTGREASCWNWEERE